VLNVILFVNNIENNLGGRKEEEGRRTQEKARGKEEERRRNQKARGRDQKSRREKG
jgi:hypothetical protein